MTPARPLHPSIVLAVAAGGALGAVLRHLVGDLLGGSPGGTLAINATGSFLLALLPASAWVRRHALLPPLLGTGLLGGFTTLSAWSEETRLLVADGTPGLAALYATGTVAVCLAAVALADRLSTPADRAEFDEEEGDL